MPVLVLVLFGCVMQLERLHTCTFTGWSLVQEVAEDSGSASEKEREGESRKEEGEPKRQAERVDVNSLDRAVWQDHACG